MANLITYLFKAIALIARKSLLNYMDHYLIIYGEQPYVIFTQCVFA